MLSRLTINIIKTGTSSFYNPEIQQLKKKTKRVLLCSAHAATSTYTRFMVDV